MVSQFAGLYMLTSLEVAGNLYIYIYIFFFCHPVEIRFFRSVLMFVLSMSSTPDVEKTSCAV